MAEEGTALYYIQQTQEKVRKDIAKIGRRIGTDIAMSFGDKDDQTVVRNALARYLDSTLEVAMINAINIQNKKGRTPNG